MRRLLAIAIAGVFAFPHVSSAATAAQNESTGNTQVLAAQDTDVAPLKQSFNRCRTLFAQIAKLSHPDMSREEGYQAANLIGKLDRELRISIEIASKGSLPDVCVHLQAVLNMVEDARFKAISDGNPYRSCELVGKACSKFNWDRVMERVDELRKQEKKK